MKFKLPIAAAFAIALVAGFQNCSKVSFNSDTNNTLNTQAVNQDPNIPDDPKFPPSFPTDNVPDAPCKSYQEITAADGQLLTIPARTSAGVCYLAKLVDSANFNPSFSNPSSELEVVSRNHDKDVNNSLITHHPYNMGKKSVRIVLKGERQVKLSGGKNDTQKILVDNFILIGLLPTQYAGDPNYYKAYGTSDSSVNNTDKILFKDVGVRVTPFATGGTSTISPLSLEANMQVDREYTLDVRALDAGSIGIVSDIYLLFK